MAHLSGDETYLNAFNSGQDPHLAIAATKYHVPYEEALKYMRMKITQIIRYGR